MQIIGPEIKLKRMNYTIYWITDPLISYMEQTFSFASTSGELSDGSEGQTAGLGHGNMLSEALIIKEQRVRVL